MRNVEPYSLFSYWKDGNTHVEVNPDPPSAQEALPFHVAIFDASYIPVSILVFGRNKTHALSRVRQALAECRDGQYRKKPDPHGLSDELRKRAQKYLNAIDKGTMRVTVEPFDVATISAKVNWAENGGIL